MTQIEFTELPPAGENTKYSLTIVVTVELLGLKLAGRKTAKYILPLPLNHSELCVQIVKSDGGCGTAKLI